MALSQADFYAYSRATGAPVPENPEDRAQMAPEVLAFRRNQLKAPQQQREQGPDPLSVGLGVGLALAGGVGAALGARRLFGGRKQAANAGVRQVNLSEMAAPESPVRRVATESIPEPSKVATQEPNPWDLPYTPKPETGVTPVSVSVLPQKLLSAAEVATQKPTSYPSLEERQRVYAEVAAKPKSELQPVYKPKGGTQEEPLITDPNTGEIFKAGKSPLSFAERYISLRPELKGQRTDLPIGRTPGTFKEFSQQAEEFNPRSYIEARGSVAPAEDLTSVQQQSLPQVIDQKINAVESGVNQQEFQTISTVQRNEDVDISFVQKFLQNERDEIASQMGELGLTNPSLVEKELANRIGPQSYEYGSQYTKIKQLMEVGLEDPRYLKAASLGKMPTTRVVAGQEFPVTVKDVMEDEPGFAFRKPFISEETAISSEQDFVNAQNEIKNWLGSVRVEIAPQLNKLKQEEATLGEQHNILMYTLNKQPDPELGKQFTLISNQLKENRAQQDFLNRRLNGATISAQDKLSELSKWTPTTLIDWSGEGTVVRPKQALPDTMSFEAEGGELSNIERGSRVAQPGPQDLEIVPGGLLSGGRAKIVSNIGQDVGFDPETGERIFIPLVDEAGERIVQKFAGKRMGEDVNVRGRGGVAGLATKASIGIYGPELSEYGTAAQTKAGQYTTEASQIPSLVNPEPVQRKTGGFFTYPQQRETDPTKYVQTPTPERRRSVLMSEQVRKGQLQFPQQPIGPYPSSLLTSKPARLNVPQQQIAQPPVQLAFPSDVVPEAGRAGVRQTAADIAANQLEAYMSRLQRGRSTPLTSAVRIQPTLF